VRKSTALLSASTVGAMTVIGAAAPAAADIITEPRCTTFNDHIDMATGDLSGDWYMECVPQYGLGKAEFTLEAPDSGFPDGFDPLTADHTDSPDASGLAPYFDSFSPADGVSGWVMPAVVDEDRSTANSLVIQSVVFAPVASVGSLDEAPAEVLGACGIEDGVLYEAFVSTYSPVTTTFTFLDEGVTYSAPVALAPDPTYYLFVDDGSGDGPQVCITDTRQTAFGSTDGSTLDVTLVGLVTVPPFVWFEGLDLEDPETALDNLPNLGVFAFSGLAPDDGGEPDPELAATGAQTGALSIVAGALGGAGALLFAFARWRRRKERTQP